MPPRTEDAADHDQRLTAVRAELRRIQLDGLVVSVGDGHHTEWPRPDLRRLEWLVGFPGSAGTAIVTAAQLDFLTDGRYLAAAERDVRIGRKRLHNVRDTSLPQLLARTLAPGQAVGLDGSAHSAAEVGTLRDALSPLGVHVRVLDRHPIDSLRVPQVRSTAPARVHELQYAGESSASKRDRLATGLRERGASAVLLSAPDSICWLLNVRGADHPHLPIVYAFALVRDDASVDLYADPAKFTAEVREALGPDVRVHAYDDIRDALRQTTDAVLELDPQSTSESLLVAARAGGYRVQFAPDPCVLPRALKNAREVEGARAAHRRDGVACCRFWRWWDHAARESPIRESDVRDRIDALRAEDPLFRGCSFETIPALGPNAALPHYRVTPASERASQRDDVLLLDSGGQYLDGTTDVTRTFVTGAITDEFRARYTAVLKSFIRASSARFPDGTRGVQIDAIARDPLWRAGIDFDHGLGHGVGSFLGVHEGPQRIRPGAAGLEPLRPGMIVSIEPGYYAAGRYGIRIENLVVITGPGTSAHGTGMLAFEPLTCCPIDLAPVDVAALDRDERAWLDRYHAWVAAMLEPLLDDGDRTWLRRRTEPVNEQSRATV